MQVKILQFLILAGFACNFHGSQGCSYRILYVDMATFFPAAHAYVAVSHARSLRGLYVLTHRFEAFLVHPYYMQLWNWVMATCVLASKPVQHIPPYERRTFKSTLIAGIMCVSRSWHTKSHFPQNLDAGTLKVTMLLILQHISFRWWSYIDGQLQRGKLALDIDTSMRTERNSHVRADGLMAHLSNQIMGCSY